MPFPSEPDCARTALDGLVDTLLLRGWTLTPAQPGLAWQIGGVVLELDRTLTAPCDPDDGDLCPAWISWNFYSWDDALVAETACIVCCPEHATSSDERWFPSTEAGVAALLAELPRLESRIIDVTGARTCLRTPAAVPLRRGTWLHRIVLELAALAGEWSLHDLAARLPPIHPNNLIVNLTDLNRLGLIARVRPGRYKTIRPAPPIELSETSIRPCTAFFDGTEPVDLPAA